jgi:hypothetical protein
MKKERRTLVNLTMGRRRGCEDGACKRRVHVTVTLTCPNRQQQFALTTKLFHHVCTHISHPQNKFAYRDEGQALNKGNQTEEMEMRGDEA